MIIAIHYQMSNALRITATGIKNQINSPRGVLPNMNRAGLSCAGSLNFGSWVMFNMVLCLS